MSRAIPHTRPGSAAAAATAAAPTGPIDPPDPSPPWRRADLHCHSRASTEADEAVLNALQCPECYSEPIDVVAQAKRRGMDFVTITDHDCLDGVLSLGPRPDLIVGEELTCYFPEDRCKMHVLVWGVTPADHDALQARSGDIYHVAAYIEAARIAHAVAHPLYRQNDLLGRWHLERLLLMFKGFECTNGAHSLLHKQALEPVLDRLTAASLADMADRHDMRPRWPEPWVKTRTGGSDDHGLLNVGRTWTEFPPDVTTPAEALQSIRDARCRPGGEPGSSLKLAHNFYGVGVRYYTRTMATGSGGSAGGTGRATLVTQLLETLVGDRRRPRRRDLVRLAVRDGVRAARRQLARPFRRAGLTAAAPAASGTGLLGRLALGSVRARTAEQTALLDAAARGVAPLGEHEAFFRLVSAVNRDVSAGLFDAVRHGLSRGDMAPLFDALSAVAAQQFGLLPYYFALFHQNKERHLCGGVTGFGKPADAAGIKVGLFTDTFDEVNGVARFLRRIGREATARGRHLTIATCDKPVGDPPRADAPRADSPQANRPAVDRVNFEPLASVPLPQYPELTLSVPPVLEVLEWADRQQFDVVHVSTPGPMGLVGLLVAAMLRVPVVATYHTDFPAFVRELTGDHRLTTATTGYMGWFYARAAAVFARSRSYEGALRDLGVRADAIHVLPPCTDPDGFGPRWRDAGLYPRLGVREPLRLLYVGRVSREKNLALLADAFAKLRAARDDVALVVVGDGPYLAELKRRLDGLPAHFLGYRKGPELAALYASADLFVFPSRTDTLGQAVIEAQASGLPVVVGDAGGPQEVMDDTVTGQVVPGTSPADWADAIDALLDDLPGRARMARTAAQRAARHTRGGAHDVFWDQHVRAVQAAAVTDLWGEPAAVAGSAGKGKTASAAGPSVDGAGVVADHTVNGEGAEDREEVATS